MDSDGAGDMGGDIKGTKLCDEFVCMKVDKSGLESTFCTTAFISSVILNFFSKSSKDAVEFNGTVAQEDVDDALA